MEPDLSGKQERERSTIEFPYTSLDDGILVAKAVHKLGGNQCQLNSLAAELGHDTVKSGGFRQRLSTAHTFGFTSLSRGIVSLSPLGAKIVDPEQEKAARIEAFLKVPLYSAIYEEFKNGTLPPSSGLETKMVALGVSNKQKEKARQAFRKSAKEAGFFAYGTTKLVYPALGGVSASPKPKEPEEKVFDLKGKNGNGGDGGNGSDGLNPFIKGLIDELPEPKSTWATEDRRNWLELALSIFNVVYKGADSSRRLVITIEENSAK